MIGPAPPEGNARGRTLPIVLAQISTSTSGLIRGFEFAYISRDFPKKRLCQSAPGACQSASVYIHKIPTGDCQGTFSEGPKIPRLSSAYNEGQVIKIVIDTKNLA